MHEWSRALSASIADDADVIIVGGGPAGSATAFYCAQAGLSVILLDKASFPRDKICGDGLTPRAVAEMARMGVEIKEEDGWIRNKGLRVIGGGHRLEIPWPEVSAYPSYGMARARTSLDQILLEHARAAGADVREQTSVSGPIIDPVTGWVQGVTARPVTAAGRRDGEEFTLRAPLVVDAGGVSARLAIAAGREKDNNRPMGVAVRTYFKSKRHDDPWMESHLELWDGKPNESNLLPGYGWIFPLGDGTINVGLGSVSATAQATKIDYRGVFETWMKNAPGDWDFSEENMLGPVRGAALPMAFNRKPLYARGLMLVGDAGGMVSPFNGEGIAYGIQAGRVAAEAIARGLAAPNKVARERDFMSYGEAMKEDLGGYYQLGRVFVNLIERPEIMHLCVHYGLGVDWLMKFVMKLLADCYEPHGGDAVDRVISGLTRLVPAA